MGNTQLHGTDSWTATCSFDANGGLGAGSKIVEQAARGDLCALQSLVNVSIDAALAVGEDDPYAIVSAAEALTFARLCAGRGVQSDVRKLAGALCLTAHRTRRIGFEDAADALTGESIAILERLASDGDDIAAVASEGLVRGNAAAAAHARDSLLMTRAGRGDDRHPSKDYTA